LIPTHAYDVIVVGAGPAGAASAIVLKQAGLSVCLLDEVDEQARRVGESLPGAVLRSLRRLGIGHLGDLLGDHEYHACVANVSAWGHDAWSRQEAMANPEGGGWHVLRHRFDSALRRYAVSLGIDHIPEKLGTLHPGDPSAPIVVSTRSGGAIQLLKARFVVDATGRLAAVGRSLGSIRKRLSDQCAAVAWVRHPVEDVDQTTRLKSVPDGWWYTARLPQGMRVIAYHGLSSDVVPRTQCAELFFKSGHSASLLPYRLSPDELLQPIKGADAGVHLGEPLGGPNWIAVGDAALSFDPLSSQGILFALYSGIRGAETVIHCLARPDSTDRFQSEYRQKVLQVYEANQRARRLFYSGERRYLASAYWQTQQGRW
jgi:flavin-dependent dehydrogenase